MSFLEALLLVSILQLLYSRYSVLDVYSSIDFLYNGVRLDFQGTNKTLLSFNLLQRDGPDHCL